MSKMMPKALVLLLFLFGVIAVDAVIGITGTGTPGVITAWVTNSSVGDSNITENSSGIYYVGSPICTSTNGACAAANQTDNYTTSVSVTGTSTKTINIAQKVGANLSASWSDDDSGNTTQEIREAVNNTELNISGFNNGYVRWITPYHHSPSSSMSANNGVTYFQQFSVDKTTTFDGVYVGALGTGGGNISIGIWSEGSPGTPVGGTLLGDSGLDESGPGAWNFKLMTFDSDVTIDPGTYYVSIHYSQSGFSTLRSSNLQVVVEWAYTSSRSFANSLNAPGSVSSTGSNMPVLQLKAVS